MKNKKLNIATIGLVTLLMISGFSSVVIGLVDANMPKNGAFHMDRDPQLHMDLPEPGDEFEERTLIIVHVVNGDGDSMRNVLVEMVDSGGQTIREDYTSRWGYAYLIAPLVDEDTEVTLRATKYGYKMDVFNIWIINKFLRVSAPNEVDEGETFVVTVKDQYYNPLKGAKVTFDGQNDKTNNQGKVTFSAPNVNENTVYTIVASKAFYENGEKPITVLDTGNPEAVTVCGHVVYDAGENGWLPAVEAEIRLDGAYQDSTDGNGHYSFVFTPDEGGVSYEITASYGDMEDSWSGVINGNEETIHINLALKEQDGGSDGSLPDQQTQGQQQGSQQQQNLC